MSSQSSHSAAASAAGCEKVVLENPLSCLSESAPSNIPLSKRVKLSEIKHNMGIENITVNTESSDSSCSTISLPEDFDPVPALVNATGYVRKHLQQSVLCHDTELSLLSSESSHRLSADTLENLALDSKFPSWKLDSIKAGGSLLAFGNDDGAPLSEVAGPPGPRSRTEGMANTPQTFRYSPTSWKITSAERDFFVFLETIKGVPPETVMWTDHQHGSYINPTTWVSSVHQRKGVYHYSSQTSAADKFSPVFPNYVCDDSKESAAHILVQRKGYKPQRRGADAETKCEKQPHPADGVDGLSECPLPDKEIHDPDHEMAAVRFGVIADGLHDRNSDVDVNDDPCEDFRSSAEMAGSIGLPPDAPITANEKPISLVISNDDDNHSGYDGNVNNPFKPDGNIPIHGGRCGSGRSSPMHG
ncbi:hypothetical protein TWF217_005276 [Orbilia oligospora]|nr:hypothetical protein TWF217_005276 [Orbilia oligospora]